MFLELTIFSMLAVKIIICAPKLGHILFNPLLFESYVTKTDRIERRTLKQEVTDDQSDWLEANLQIPSTSGTVPVDELRKGHCSGYDFNETLCKVIDDRIICGYNKNIGDIKKQIINLANGCRIRSNRLECGYINGPFNGIRRPTANDDTSI